MRMRLWARNGAKLVRQAKRRNAGNQRIGAFIEGGFGRNAYAFCMKRRGREELGVSVQRALHFFVGDR